MTNFGRMILEKYGWKEGKGLGTDESGIANPIKVRGNFNVYGLGLDVGKEFTSQWWDHVYNRTADNMIVGKSEDGSIQVTKKDDVGISQKVVPYVHSTSSQYSSFVKAGELMDVPVEKDMSLKLSYDELFKICGGKTAHKGARHGITMSAKLARVEKQERELMEQWKNKSSNESEEVQHQTEKKQKKRKKSRNKDEEINVYDIVSQNELKDEEPQCVERDYSLKKHKKDKKKKKRENKMESLSTCDENTVSCSEYLPHENGCSGTGEIASEGSFKRSKKEKKILIEESSFIAHEDYAIADEVIKKTKKKKKKSKSDEKENTVDIVVLTVDNEVTDKKKKKKKDKKRKKEKMENECLTSEDLPISEECRDIVADNIEIEGQTDDSHKKKKKKHKHTDKSV